MSKLNGNDTSFVMSSNHPGKKLKWSIEFDGPLRALLDQEGIDDPDDQMMVCEALCRIDLADYQLSGEDTDDTEIQEHCYTSTKTMRKLAEKCQL